MEILGLRGARLGCGSTYLLNGIGVGELRRQLAGLHATIHATRCIRTGRQPQTGRRGLAGARGGRSRGSDALWQRAQECSSFARGACRKARRATLLTYVRAVTVARRRGGGTASAGGADVREGEGGATLRGGCGTLMSFGYLNVSGLSQRANSLGSVAAQLSSLRAYITYIAAVPRRGFLWGGGPAARLQTPVVMTGERVVAWASCDGCSRCGAP